MNTIPLTFDQNYVERTVVGGTDVPRENSQGLPVTVILLNRGGRYYREAVFEELIAQGLSSIVSIETSGGVPIDFETLTGRFPGIKFVIPRRKITAGEMINIGIAEAKTPYCFVIWNDAHLTKNGIHSRVIEKISESPTVCFSPFQLNNKLEMIPTLMVPVQEKKTFRVERIVCSRDNALSIYAADFIGLYNRDLFIAMEGFDSSITDPYWQNLDFGFRSHLWGCPVRISTMFKVSYENEIPVEAIESNDSYTRFFLKNIAVVYDSSQGGAVLPIGRLPGYIALSGKNIPDAIRSFFLVKKWVKRCSTHFSMGGADLISSWTTSRENFAE